LAFKVKNGLTSLGTIIAPAATTSLAPIRIPHGTAPSAPTNGDLWTTTAGIYVRINGTTVGPLGSGSGGGVTVSATAPASPTEGALWFDSDTGVTSVYYSSTWVDIGGGPPAQGGGTDQIFYENDTTVTTDYTITTGKNAMSAGPISINSGVTVTVPSNSVWTIV